MGGAKPRRHFYNFCEIGKEQDKNMSAVAVFTSMYLSYVMLQKQTNSLKHQ